MNYSVQWGELQMLTIAILWGNRLAWKQFLRHNWRRENPSGKRPGHRPHVHTIAEWSF